MLHYFHAKFARSPPWPEGNTTKINNLVSAKAHARRAASGPTFSKEPTLERTLRVLLADDNEDIVLTLRMLLEEEGHVVRARYTGHGVVDEVRAFAPNVCILDIDMPGANGFAIARELKAAYGASRPFLVAISGKWFRAADRLLALEAGFDHFLEKPAPPDEVSRLLADVSRRMQAAP